MVASYPDKIKQLALYDGRFAAYKLAAQGTDVLFVCYPAGTEIQPHTHDTNSSRYMIYSE